MAKAESITKMVDDCNRDSKKLYNLAALLMGTVKENPLPDHTDKEEHANQFASFFINKIQDIRDQLDTLPTYCHISIDPQEFLELLKGCQQKYVTWTLSQPHFLRKHYQVYCP